MNLHNNTLTDLTKDRRDRYMREAEQHRMTQTDTKRNPALATLGRQMVKLGEKLQS